MCRMYNIYPAVLFVDSLREIDSIPYILRYSGRCIRTEAFSYVDYNGIYFSSILSVSYCTTQSVRCFRVHASYNDALAASDLSHFRFSQYSLSFSLVQYNLPCQHILSNNFISFGIEASHKSMGFNVNRLCDIGLIGSPIDVARRRNSCALCPR